MAGVDLPSGLTAADERYRSTKGQPFMSASQGQYPASVPRPHGPLNLDLMELGSGRAKHKQTNDAVGNILLFLSFR